MIGMKEANWVRVATLTTLADVERAMQRASVALGGMPAGVVGVMASYVLATYHQRQLGR